MKAAPSHLRLHVHGFAHHHSVRRRSQSRTQWMTESTPAHTQHRSKEQYISSKYTGVHSKCVMSVNKRSLPLTGLLGIIAIMPRHKHALSADLTRCAPDFCAEHGAHVPITPFTHIRPRKGQTWAPASKCLGTASFLSDVSIDTW